MDCNLADICGGCSFRNMPTEEYRQHKINCVKQALQSITRQDFSFSTPIFIADGNRRRASLAFQTAKRHTVLGFNSPQSKQVNQVDFCPLLTPKINRNLAFLQQLAAAICQVKISRKIKKNKFAVESVSAGDIWVTEADNGLDVVLEFDRELNLELRQLIFEMAQQNNDIVRVSHRRNFEASAETVVAKALPSINIAGREVDIPAGTFLQPSAAGEKALINLVLQYLGATRGRIADLFCGVGTFSYALSAQEGNKVVAADVSPELLQGFRQSLRRQMIANVEVVDRNLFKYPLSGDELANFAAVVFDPPRAGAKEQAKALAALAEEKRPTKLIAVSCNPTTFARDAEILQNGGYRLSDVTMVDQFIYSRHCELVALFVSEAAAA